MVNKLLIRPYFWGYLFGGGELGWLGMMRAVFLILYFWCASFFYSLFFLQRHFAGEESAMNSGVIDFWWNWDSAPWLGLKGWLTSSNFFRWTWNPKQLDFFSGLKWWLPNIFYVKDFWKNHPTDRSCRPTKRSIKIWLFRVPGTWDFINERPSIPWSLDHENQQNHHHFTRHFSIWEIFWEAEAGASNMSICVWQLFCFLMLQWAPSASGWQEWVKRT